MAASGRSGQMEAVPSEEIQESLERLHGLLLGYPPQEELFSFNASDHSNKIEGAGDSDAIRLLQYILLGPLETSMQQLAAKVEVLEEHVFDPTLSLKLAELQTQVADRSHLDDLRGELAQFSGLNIPSQINNLVDRVILLENQLYEPEELMKLLLPLLNDLIQRKVEESGEEFARATAPVLDEMIRRKITQDKISMGKALAPVVGSAIGYQMEESPGELATVIGPEMNIAIKEQVRSNAAAMIDALYPIIGSTIGKYIAEILRNINEKLEQSMSPEGIWRKIRARYQGISEAELILKESSGFQVQSVFLIQRLSGLVIAQANPPDSPFVEADMIGGMLTAIRGFVHECISQNGDLSELDRIAYGNSLICLEGAGHAYLAVVTHGEPPPRFLEKVRRVMTILVLDFGKVIENYEGSTWTVPVAITNLVASLIPEPTTRPRSLRFMWLMAALLITAIAVPLGIGQYQARRAQLLIEQAKATLSNTPELSVYQVQVKVANNQIKLEGKLPNTYLRDLAQATVQKAFPDQPVQNAIVAVHIPTDPLQTAAETARLTNLLKQRPGMAITTQFQNGVVHIAGQVANANTISEVSQAFARIPGVRSVSSALQVPLPRLDIQIFFAPDLAELKPEDDLKIETIKAFLQEHPNLRLNIIGQSDVSGSALVNQELALHRARSVKNSLVGKGIAPQRLRILGYPPSSQVRWSDRRVQFEVLPPG